MNKPYSLYERRVMKHPFVSQTHADCWVWGTVLSVLMKVIPTGHIYT